MQRLDISECQTPFEADLSVLESFREVDPASELLYLGEGRWMLGVMSPINQFRYKTAGELLTRELSRDDSNQRLPAIRKARAALQGFKPITEYSKDELDSGYALLDFRVTDWLYRKNRDALFEAALTASMQGVSPEEIEQRKEAAVYRARDIWRTVHKQHFTSATLRSR